MSSSRSRGSNELLLPVDATPDRASRSHQSRIGIPLARPDPPPRCGATFANRTKQHVAWVSFIGHYSAMLLPRVTSSTACARIRISFVRHRLVRDALPMPSGRGGCGRR